MLNENIYACIYEVKDGVKMHTIDYTAQKPQEFVKIIPQNTLLLGDGIARYSQIFDSGGSQGWEFAEKELWYPRAEKVALLGLRLYKIGHKDDLFKLVPMYLRPTEAEVKFKGVKQ